eukprot:m.75291 g.75291  ORF g.75291 m.75291 type:complete len:63 (-) comp13972_c1_seq1:2440-2628(-)
MQTHKFSLLLCAGLLLPLFLLFGFTFSLPPPVISIKVASGRNTPLGHLNFKLEILNSLVSSG